ncbi:MAG: sensor domain-containing protein [Rhodanobacteraceae bacterium]
MTSSTPRTIEEYLDQLRVALRGADPALIQDALYDAEDHLRSELAENPGKSEAEVLAKIATTYGAAEEVAEIYVDKEHQVQQALRSPPPPPRRTALGRFFGIGSDPRAYASLFYMMLSLATGIFYFVWVVAGMSISIGTAILIFGLAFAVLFFGTVRVLSLVEGRIIEVMLGERMPRRPVYAERGLTIMERIKAMFVDPRTWSTILYMLLMLPLGIIYFTVAVTGTTLSLALMLLPIAIILRSFNIIGGGGIYFDGEMFLPPLLALPLCFVIGAFLLFAMLHLARGVGRFQSALAKSLLVKSAD